MSGEIEDLYRAYYMEVYSYLMSAAKKQDLAEELTQKTFYKAAAAGQAFRGDASEGTWLCAIAKNLYVDELRERKKRGETAEEPASQDNIEETLIDQDSAFRIHQILHDLEEPYKEVFQLRIFGELAFRKIGLLFGKMEVWARVTYHRARIQVQERMRPFENQLGTGKERG